MSGPRVKCRRRKDEPEGYIAWHEWAERGCDMTGKTTIEWTHMPGYEGDVWNPTTGCTRVSDGCDNCYAFALHDKRYKANLDAAREVVAGARSYLGSSSYAHERLAEAERRPIATARELGLAKLPFPRQYDIPFSQVQLLEDRLEVPLRKKKPTCYFVDSMADLFHEDVPDEYLERVWHVMTEAKRHTFLVLTKRPERARTFLAWDSGSHMPAANIWLGTSVEDQRSADERIPHLLATPAAVRFLSCEPLLGEVRLTADRGLGIYGHIGTPCHVESEGFHRLGEGMPTIERRKPAIDWVIIGGESGARARPMDLAWARSLVDQCRAAGVAPFVKQLGSKPVEYMVGVRSGPLDLRESHGRDMAEWPEDLRVREFPQGRAE